MWKIGAIWDQAYYEAAEYIVTGVCKGDLNPYVHGAAGVFLFRHSVELALESVQFYSRWLDRSKNAANRLVQEDSRPELALGTDQSGSAAKLGGDTWDGFDTGFIEKLVKDLHKADPGSYGFRFNGETFGVEPKGINDEVSIDFEALRAEMKHVYNVLHSMQVYLIETHGMNAEWEAERNRGEVTAASMAGIAHVAPLHSCKYRRLHAPATNFSVFRARRRHSVKTSLITRLRPPEAVGPNSLPIHVAAPRP